MEKKKILNVTIAFNVLYAKEEEINPPYVSKHNSNREKQVILSMISNAETYNVRRMTMALLQSKNYQHY